MTCCACFYKITRKYRLGDMTISKWQHNSTKLWKTHTTHYTLHTKQERKKKKEILILIVFLYSDLIEKLMNRLFEVVKIFGAGGQDFLRWSRSIKAGQKRSRPVFVFLHPQKFGYPKNTFTSIIDKKHF